MSTALALALVLAAEVTPAPEKPPEAGAAGAIAPAQPPPSEPAAKASAQDEGAATAPPGPSDESPPALIRRCVAAYGGERGAVRLARVRVDGTVTSALAPGEVGTYRRLFARSERLRVEVQFPGARPEVKVLDGPRGYRYGEAAPAPVVAALQLQAARLDLPALLKGWESRTDDRGEVTHEGERVRVLGLELAHGLRLEVGIEPASGRIRYVHGVGRVGPRPIELFTIYRDYRTVDGVLVAFREEGWANGEPTGDVTVKKVEFLDDVSDDAFRP
jgi:hypothetical protein